MMGVDSCPAAEINRSHAISAKAGASYARAGKLYSSRKYAEALAAYRKYLADTPKVKPTSQATVEQRIGLCLRYTKQYDEALAQFDKVLASQKGQWLWWATQVYRGDTLAAMKRFDEAEEAIALGLKSSKLSLGLMGQAYRVLTIVRLKQGEPQAALPYAKRMYEVTLLYGAVDAINRVCECYKRIDGDINPNVREFLEFQKYGPSGKDGQPGTEDDLKNPLDDAPPADEADLAAFAREAIPKLEPRACTERGRLWMLAGDYPRALREFTNAYRAAALETTKRKWPRHMTDAAGDIAAALKAIDGHVHRANQFLLFQRYGPAGKDGEPGTADDLANPLKELPADYWATHAPADKQLDAAFQAALDEKPDTYQGHRGRGYLYLAWGKPGQAMEEMKTAYKLCPLTQRDLVRAITDIAVAIKAQDLDVFRANRYLMFQKYGPKGKDAKPGTKDDLTNPLAAAK